MKSPWLLRILALAGLVLSAYLLTLKLTGRISYLAGCGEGSGCENVLGSRWSQFFYVPVTAFSGMMYALLLATTWRPFRPVCAALAVCFAGAALWFFGILAFVLEAFCPWCSAAHAIGLTCAVILAWKLKKDDRLPGSGRSGVLAGAGALAVLMLGQVFGPVPETHAIT
ncbi:MAG: vitamin K epoxide reductase family protein, partial [Akkermansiaceae bacterium]|nr:vitamin K epoxide reductase family protein [Akkermansiaceae bacterium]